MDLNLVKVIDLIVAPANHISPAEVRSSQDLYAQFQQQKKRIEEELHQLEQRDDIRRQLEKGSLISGL